MELHVAFLPEEVSAPARHAVVVIDVLRATTSVLALLEAGCAEVVIAPTVDAARRYRAAHPSVLAAGERGGRAPEGFDFGNSPAAFARSELAGKRVVLATTNGTRAMHMVEAAPVVFLGCLRNRSAAARAVVRTADAAGLDVALVCSGREGRFSLDDAVTAGAMVDAALDGSSAAGKMTLTDAAQAARTLYRAFPDLEAIFRTTRAGRNLLEIGLPEDLPYCAAQDQSHLVPRMGDRVRLLDE